MDVTRIYEQVFDLSPIAVILTDSKGIIQLTNDHTAQLMGTTVSNLANQHIDHVLPGILNDLPGKIRRKEIMAHRKDKSTFPVEVDCVQFDTPDGKMISWTLRDLSDRQSLLHDLGERIKEQLTLLHVTEIFYNTKDIKQAFAESLPHVQAGWQYPESTAVRISLADGSEFSTHNFEETPWSLRSPILSNNMPYGMLEVYYTEAFPFHGDTPFLREEERLISGLSRLFGIYVDERHAIQKLTDREEFIRNITSQIPGNSYQFEMDDGGVLTTHFSSKGAQSPFIDQGDRHTRGWFNHLVHPDDLPGFLEILKTAGRRLTDISVQYRVMVNGALTWRWLTASPQKRSDGKVYWYGYTQDITQMIEYISTLEQILFDISHVMRRPVATMLGLTNLMQSETMNENVIKTMATHFKNVASEMDEYMRKLNIAYQQRLDVSASGSSIVNQMLQKEK